MHLRGPASAPAGKNDSALVNAVRRYWNCENSVANTRVTGKSVPYLMNET